MRLEAVIGSRLAAHAPLAALVGTRIYPVTYPQGDPLPVVVYQRTSKVPEYTHDGEAGVAESRYQISSFGKTYAQAKQTASAVKSALRPWMAHQDVVSGINIGAVFMENEFDLFNAEDVEHASAYHILAEYIFLTADDD